MNDLNQKIDLLINKIDSINSFVVMTDRNGTMEKLPELVECFGIVIPDILNAYDTMEALTPYAEDKNYWPGQLERIMGAVQSGDYFFLYDSLENELKANLIELQKLI